MPLDDAARDWKGQAEAAALLVERRAGRFVRPLYDGLFTNHDNGRGGAAPGYPDAFGNHSA
jgi:hypothetical protein